MNQSLSIDNYISTFPLEVQVVMQKIRQTIQKSVPEGTETISYGIPTFDLKDTHLVHFAAFKKHIGFFPTPSGIAAFSDQLSAYKISKGTIQFPLNKAIPYELIKEITLFRKKEINQQKNNNAQF